MKNRPVLAYRTFSQVLQEARFSMFLKKETPRKFNISGG
jgi:hypothetical protein